MAVQALDKERRKTHRTMLYRYPLTGEIASTPMHTLSFDSICVFGVIGELAVIVHPTMAAVTASEDIPAMEIGHSLLDDASTIKSDAETTQATEDTYPFRHESDHMFMEHKQQRSSTSYSEHSRVDSNIKNNNATCVQHGEVGGTMNTSKGQSKIVNPSVNMGSMYEETSFPPNKLSPLEEKFSKEEEGSREPCEPPLSHQKHEENSAEMLVEQSQSWKVGEATSDQSKTDDHGGNGYGCEMIIETPALIRQTKKKAGDCFNSMLHLHETTQQSDTRVDTESAPSLGVYSSLQLVARVLGDGIDEVLVKLFNVRDIACSDKKKQTHPNYAISVNESLTNDYNHVLEAAVKSKHTMKRFKNKVKKNLKVLEENNELAEQASPEVILVPLTPKGTYAEEWEEKQEPMPHQIHEVHGEHSDIRDELDQILSDVYREPPSRHTQHTVPHDSLAKIKRSLYADLLDKCESTSFASSIDSNINRDKNERVNLGGSLTAPVAISLDKTAMDRDTIDKMGHALENLSPSDEWTKDVNLSALHQKVVQHSVTTKLHPILARPSQNTESPRNEIDANDKDVDNDDNDENNDDDKSTSDVRLSSLYGQHVVKLINKNLDSTNRSEFIDLSHLNAVEDDQFLEDRTPESLVRRSCDSKTAIVVEAANPAFDFETNRAEPLCEDEAFAVVDEIDITLNKRREKLRKMMEDLSQIMDEAVNGKKTPETRQDVVDVEERYTNKEVRVVLSSEMRATEHAAIQPIDLTQYIEPIDLTLYEECF
jgi:hypothetical protein